MLIEISLAIGLFEKHYARALRAAGSASNIPVHLQAPRNQPDQCNGITLPFRRLRVRRNLNFLERGRKLINTWDEKCSFWASAWCCIRYSRCSAVREFGIRVCQSHTLHGKFKGIFKRFDIANRFDISEFDISGINCIANLNFVQDATWLWSGLRVIVVLEYASTLKQTRSNS